VEARALGRSGMQVSRLALGSWRTFERIGEERGLEVMRAARDIGITFLDDARYDDETGRAPLPTGYSEVLFGDLFRKAGWPRDETVVSNKLWWEFWPQQTASAELDGSLARMGFEHVDLIYANPPPEGLALDEMVAAVAALVTSGRARAWGIVNWPAELLAAAAEIAERLAVPQPCAAQLPYSIVQRLPVESAEMIDALTECGAAVVASFTLAGGVLTGKYDRDPAAGRATGTLAHERVAPAVTAGTRLRALAQSLDTSPAALAFAYALANPRVATVLFGATSSAQVRQNAAALDIVVDDATLASLSRVGTP
jgi:aryl-alcohol dehydrogenase-like predicted oxidoreductase